MTQFGIGAPCKESCVKYIPYELRFQAQALRQTDFWALKMSASILKDSIHLIKPNHLLSYKLVSSF